ncbi:MAG: TonB-dependent receptor [Bacteroidales bacterium]|nr:TonB-dependent receptor [Bacteroidales bacterium]
MKNFIFISLFSVAYLVSHAQILTIRDGESNQPLEMVTLFSENPLASGVTNAHGQAEISAFKGSSKIEIRMIGYQAETKSYDQLANSGFILVMIQDNITLDQYTVVATRWSQSKREIPAKITSLTPKDITLENPQTAADLLGSSGEIFIQKSQLGGGSPMIRGFATNRLLITVDGIRMNTAIFRSGNLQNVISLDPFSTERVEVFFGPSSVIYGSDAIGGVMSFSTLTSKLSVDDKVNVSGNAALRFSSADKERTGHFDVNVGWKKWALVSSFSQFYFDDLRMGLHGPDEYLRPFYTERVDSTDIVVTNDDPMVQKPTGYSQTNLMQKVRFKPSEKWDFEYGFHYSTTTDYPRYDRLLRTKNGLPRSAEWNYGPQDWMMNNLTITNSSNCKIYDQLTMRLAYQHFEESRIDRDFNDNERRIRLEKVDAFSANLDFAKHIRTNHNFYYGLELVYDDVYSTGMDEDVSTAEIVEGPARYPKSTWASYAAYLTYMYKPSEKMNIQAGARYNQYVLDAEFDTTFYPFPYTTANIDKGSLTGSLGVVLNPVQSLTLSANLSTGFRAPNVDDMGKVFDSEPGSVVVPNPDLEAEYAYNAEIDIAKIFGDVVKIDLAAFYTILENAMVRRDYTLNGQDSIMYNGEMSKVQAVQNSANAYVYGLQAGMEIKLPAGFEISSYFNYQKGEEELDDGTTSPLRHAAPWFGKSSLKLFVNKLLLDFYGMYSGEISYENMPEEEKGKDYIYAIDPDGNPYSPGWYTLNFKALYQLTEQFSITAGIENLTDQRYRPYSSGIVASGRNFIIALKASF